MAFVWTFSQTNEDVTLHIPLIKGIARRDVHVDVQERHLVVRYGQMDEAVIDGDLVHPCEPATSSWQLDREAGELTVVLEKAQAQLRWERVITNVDNGAKRSVYLLADTEALFATTEGGKALVLGPAVDRLRLAQGDNARLTAAFVAIACDDSRDFFHTFVSAMETHGIHADDCIFITSEYNKKDYTALAKADIIMLSGGTDVLASYDKLGKTGVADIVRKRADTGGIIIGVGIGCIHLGIFAPIEAKDEKAVQMLSIVPYVIDVARPPAEHCEWKSLHWIVDETTQIAFGLVPGGALAVHPDMYIQPIRKPAVEIRYLKGEKKVMQIMPEDELTTREEDERMLRIREEQAKLKAALDKVKIREEEQWRAPPKVVPAAARSEKDAKPKRQTKQSHVSSVTIEEISDEEQEAAGPPQLSQEELKLLGNHLFKEGKYREAIARYKEANECFSTIDYNDFVAATLYSNSAACYSALEEWEEAVRECSLAIALDAKHVKAHFRRGLAYEKLARYSLARMDFATVLSLDPKNRPAKRAEKRVVQTMEALKTDEDREREARERERREAEEARAKAKPPAKRALDEDEAKRIDREAEFLGNRDAQMWLRANPVVPRKLPPAAAVAATTFDKWDQHDLVPIIERKLNEAVADLTVQPVAFQGIVKVSKIEGISGEAYEILKANRPSAVELDLSITIRWRGAAKDPRPNHEDKIYRTEGLLHLPGITTTAPRGNADKVTISRDAPPPPPEGATPEELQGMYQQLGSRSDPAPMALAKDNLEHYARGLIPQLSTIVEQIIGTLTSFEE